jgi:hypothetical protein
MNAKLVGTLRGCCFLALVVAVLLGAHTTQAQVTVKTVPLDPANLTTPHTTFNGATIVLGATVDVHGSADPFTVFWNFGDGSAIQSFALAKPYDISTTHAYPAAAAVGTTWTASVTVTDNNNASITGTANYLVIQGPNNLASAVDVAIDTGLWTLHKTMQRYMVAGVNEGGWDIQFPSPGCIAPTQTCDNINGSVAIDANAVQAFEVNGHLQNGPASDPYTDDVARGLARLETYLAAFSVVPNKPYNFNAPPTCPNGGTTPCTFTFDGNGNGQYVLFNDPTGQTMYTTGQVMDAFIASSTPNAVAVTGPAGVKGKKFVDIVQDALDAYSYCQYGSNFNVDSAAGGAWLYGCLQGDDSSVSQWAAIGAIGAQRGFGLTIPPIVQSANAVWITYSQAADGSFGYRGKTPVWGPYADTPSSMVQMAMDGIGRGDARWDKAETFMRDNFGNTGEPGCGVNAQCQAGVAPKAYTYGLFSFTKSMLLHNAGGALAPIVLLQSKTPGVSPIDWYAAEVSKGAPTDGVARTLVNRQDPGGFWTGHSFVGQHYPFETAWSIIMLRKTVFVQCVNNLGGRGTPGGTAPARIDLTWTGIPNTASYDVLRGTVNQGPYTKVGNTTTTAFSDRTGLSNSKTYYYVLQPLSASGVEICQSNQATVPIPAPH